MKDFLARIATRGTPVADIEEGYISTASCILANIVDATGPHAAWDAAKPARSRTMRKRTNCCTAPTARRGCIQSLPPCKQRSPSFVLEGGKIEGWCNPGSGIP